MLEIKDISKSFKKNLILHSISFKVSSGESFAIYGKSGSGKTTLFRIIAGLLTPEKGNIIIKNVNYTNSPPYNRPIGFQFQSYALFPNFNVRNNIRYPLLWSKHHTKTNIEDRIDQIIEELELNHLLERRIDKLSGGEQQRVALGRALVRALASDGVLLLDEPISALDEALRENARMMIRDIQKKFELTTILITHDSKDVIRMADRIGVLSNSQLVQVGTIAEISKNPKTESLALSFGYKFIGNAKYFNDENNCGIIFLGNKIKLPKEYFNQFNDGEILDCYLNDDSFLFDEIQDITYKANVISVSESNTKVHINLTFNNEYINLDFSKERLNEFFPTDKVISFKINWENVCLLKSKTLTSQ